MYVQFTTEYLFASISSALGNKLQKHVSLFLPAKRPHNQENQNKKEIIIEGDAFNVQTEEIAVNSFKRHFFLRRCLGVGATQ